MAKFPVEKLSKKNQHGTNFLERSEYAALSRLRMFWPNTPGLALTATMGPHVGKYIHKSLQMTKPTRLIKRCVDRPNIYFHRIGIRNASVFSELDWLVPKGICDAQVIPKTIVFIDSLPGVCAMVDYLIARLKQEWTGERPPHRDLICDFSTALSLERREQILASFQEGHNRLLVCTEACGMGLDIGDVLRVIQWKATKLLNLATFFQRAGRAGRISSNRTVAILYHQESLGNLQGAYEIFKRDIDGPAGSELLAAIRTFDFGSDEAAAVRRGKNSTKNILKNQGIQMEHGADDAEGPDACKVICRGILSYIGTQGCMRSILLKYFDSPYHSERVASRCCFSCSTTGNYELEHDIQQLLPSRDPTNDSNDDHSDDNAEELPRLSRGMSRGTTKYKKTTTEQALAVTTSLRSLRECVLRSQWLDDEDLKYSVAPASFFLHDKEIARLAKSAHPINDEVQLAKRLTQKNNYKWAPIAPYVTDVIANIAQAMDSVELPPEAPAALRRRKPRQKTAITILPPAPNVDIPPPTLPPAPNVDTPPPTLPPAPNVDNTILPNTQTRVSRQRKTFDNLADEAKHQEVLRKRRERYARNRENKQPLGPINPAQIQNVQSIHYPPSLPPHPPSQFSVSSPNKKRNAEETSPANSKRLRTN